MERLKNTISFVDILIRLLFFLYLFSIIFGLSLPFQTKFSDQYKEMEETYTSGNLAAQMLYVVLFCASVFYLILKREMLINFIKEDKFLSLLLLWIIITIFFSNYPFVSFKRVFQTITTVTISLSFLFTRNSLKVLLNYLEILFGLFLVLSFISVLVIPGATDPGYHAWRGLANGKNLFGQICAINVFFWIYIISLKSSLFKTFLALNMTILSIVLLIGSNSITAIITTMICAMILMLKSTGNLFKPLGIGNVYMITISISITALLAYVAIFELDEIARFLQLFGKNLSFTGRTDLWMDVLHNAKRHLLFGCGFNSFWIVGSRHLNYFWDRYSWFPIQAHNGYVDLLNETGIIGLVLLILLIINYYISIRNQKKYNIWAIIFLIGLIINFQETSLLKARTFIWGMFCLSYLIQFIKNDMVKTE